MQILAFVMFHGCSRCKGKASVGSACLFYLCRLSWQAVGCLFEIYHKLHIFTHILAFVMFHGSAWVLEM